MPDRGAATSASGSTSRSATCPSRDSGRAAVGQRGPNAFLVGGRTGDAVRPARRPGNLAPQAPFFQLGLVGAAVPALKIEGEIGQQLGYLNAAGAGTVNFIMLIVIGWAYAHKERRGPSRRGASVADRRATLTRR